MMIKYDLIPSDVGKNTANIQVKERLNMSCKCVNDVKRFLAVSSPSKKFKY